MKTDDTHPLLRKRFGMLRHWCRWKKAWDQAEHAEQMMGLLHVAFDMESHASGDAEERFLFLLDVADGYADYDWLKKPEDYPTFGCSYGRLEPTGLIGEAYQMRSTVARKAMQVLCDRALSFERVKGTQSTWLFLRPEVFGKLLWFLDDGDRRERGYNLSDRDHDRLDRAIGKFALELIGNAWPLRHDAFGAETLHELDRVSGMFQAARPRFVRMLFRMHALDRLVSRDKRWLDMGEAELRVLRDVARLRSHVSARTSEYESLDEALSDGAQAAQVLLGVEACRRHHERKRRIAEAERKQRQAEEELKNARQ